MSGPGSTEPFGLEEAIAALNKLCGRLADLLALVGEGPTEEGRLLSPAEVARRWGVRRGWVYDHADELGARRLGDGSRPRLGFDPAEVRERIGAPLGEGGTGLTAIRGRRGSDSLSRPHEARFRPQREHVAGRRADAAGRAPEEALRRDGQAGPRGHEPAPRCPPRGERR